jgi:salicylate hydroxylase
MATSFIKLNIAVIGGGNGGLSAAVSLRRAGHTVTIYERRDYAGEIGAGIGIPSNGSKWLHKWGVNTDAGRPVVATKLLIHEWNTGKVLANAPLGNYREKFGYDTLMFQRCDLHRVLLDAALSQDGAGTPCKHVTDHLALSVDTEKGQVTFANGTSVVADLVIAADGIHSRLRAAMGIVPEVQQAASCAYRHVISMDKVKELGIESIGSNGALEYWNGPGANKIVIGSCHGGEVLGIYSFFP